MVKSYLKLMHIKQNEGNGKILDKQNNYNIKLEQSVIKNLSLEILEICLENTKR